MKEKIYTIPVNDAFNEPSECPLCSMYEKLEEDMLYFILENAYMEDDIRKETNELGFCQKHLSKLMQRDNRLGVALMLHTHMQKVHKDLHQLIKQERPVIKKNLFGGQAKGSSNKLVAFSHEHQKKCYICHRIDATFNLYMDTFFYLWKKDEAFSTKVKNSQGFCLHHFAQLHETSVEKLGTEEHKEFLECILPLQEENFQRVIDDLGWYITKFDYRFKDEPWKNSKDSIVRAIKKTTSLKL